MRQWISVFVIIPTIFQIVGIYLKSRNELFYHKEHEVHEGRAEKIFNEISFAKVRRQLTLAKHILLRNEDVLQ